MKRMLFNATQEEELRVAMVDGQRLYDLNIELPASERKKANIYKGTITRIEPSLEAAFVNYGAERHGFLPLKEISDEYFVNPNSGGGKPNIKEVLREGQDIVVQIDKEERGNKGAALTTFVSLAGRFIVLKPNKSRSGGVSRRIVGEDRDLARRSLKEIEVPDGMSVILRTAGIDRTGEELGWDLNNLLAIWEAIKTAVVQRPSPFLIYRESDSVVRALRDSLTNEIGEILIDDEKAHEEAREFIEQVMPHNLRKLKHYVDPVPLFTRYQIESQIESAFAHMVTLPSGGSMVIDHTEALVSIDINSARATKGGDIEATALQTNLEAADEIGRQLRLRDLGGLIVIDFIDMGPQKHQREVESRLREAVRQDRARVQIGKISRFGLLEMSRQRLRPSLGESSYLTCPRCSGVGTIRSVESLALAILRIIGEEARKERTAKVIAQLPVEVATYLLNEKRDWVQNVEARHEMQVILVANPGLETPHYVVRRVRDDQVDLPENTGTSYTLSEAEQEQIIPEAVQLKAPAELPAVSSQVKTTPAPKPRERVAEEAPEQKGGLLTRIMGLFAAPEEPEEAPAKETRRSRSGDGRSRGGQRNRRRSDGQKSDGNRQARGKKKASKKRGKRSDASEDKSAKRGGEKKAAKKRTRKKTQPKAESATAEEATQTQEKTEGKRRRSRGGRRRRRGRDNADAAPQNENTEATAQNSDSEAPQSSQAETAPQAEPQQEAAAKQDATPDSTDPSSSEKPKRKRRSKKKPKAESTATEENKDAKDAAPAEPQKADSDQRESRRDSGDETKAESADAAPRDTSDKPDDKPARPKKKRAKKAAAPKDDVEVTSANLEATPKQEQQPAKAASGNGNPESSKAPAEPPPAKPAPEKTEEAPKARLLPWEPQQPAAGADDGSADK